MHISEGILTGPSVIATSVGGAVVLIWGARSMSRFAKEQPRRRALLGMAGAFIFLVSLIPIPAFTGTTSHPCGTPLAGILLGPGIGACLASLSLLLQASFFAHGGFSSLGANTMSLGFLGAGTAWLVFAGGRRMGLPLWAAAGLGGLLGDLATYLGTGGMLATHLAYVAPDPQYGFFEYLGVIYAAYVPTQSVIAIGEMVVTGYAVHAIARQRPEVLESLGVVRKKAVAAGAIVLLLLASVAPPWVPSAVAQEPAETQVTEEPAAEDEGFLGMDEAVNEAVAEAAGAPARDPFIDLESLGDVWNTVLLGAGGICGFVIGRWWHLLFGAKGRDDEDEEEPTAP
jgi:cobalt/nickel transport system permease protein